MNLEDLAKRIRQACLEAIIQAYDEGGIQGLCAEGRWELAVSTLRTLDLTPLLRDFPQASAQDRKSE
ncbi:MAG TPA: acetyltransferase [Candidatus Binatia bacterium]